MNDERLGDLSDTYFDWREAAYLRDKNSAKWLRNECY